MEVTELWADRLSEVEVPPVVVPDSEDLSIPPSFGRELDAKIQGAEFHLLDGWDINSSQRYRSSSRN